MQLSFMGFVFMYAATCENSYGVRSSDREHTQEFIVHLHSIGNTLPIPEDRTYRWIFSMHSQFFNGAFRIIELRDVHALQRDVNFCQQHTETTIPLPVPREMRGLI